MLSYIGASDGGECGMIDIGGGSTEFTLGDDERILGAVSLQMGAVRMNAQRPILKRSLRGDGGAMPADDSRDAPSCLRLRRSRNG